MKASCHVSSAQQGAGAETQKILAPALIRGMIGLCDTTKSF